jgi:hypothetical protein
MAVPPYSMLPCCAVRTKRGEHAPDRIDASLLVRTGAEQHADVRAVRVHGYHVLRQLRQAVEQLRDTP